MRFTPYYSPEGEIKCVLHGFFYVTDINCKPSKYANKCSNMLKGTYFLLSAQYKSCNVSQVTP